MQAVNQAIADGVDVINYSIAGGGQDAWAADDSVGFLAALEAGIFVATAAGNAGPAEDTVDSPADAPWVTAVGASSHEYFYASSLIGLVNDQGEALPNILGQAVTTAIGPAAIVDASDYGNAQCLPDDKTPFSQKFAGQIVICDSGGPVSRVDKGRNVQANGGSGMILSRTNTTPDGSGYLETDAHALPAVQITYTDSQALRQWLAKGTGHRGSITATEPMNLPEAADVMAYFSSRGADKRLPSVVKPNVTAPGRAVFAPFNEGYSAAEQDYNVDEGTSMSSPHVAGSAALLKALHPKWTPMQIQSALMTTANTDHHKEDDSTPADVFDMGAGRVDLPVAARAVLLLDENGANFRAANPKQGGDPRTLNLTGLGNDRCVVKCRWQRTVTNVSDMPTMWTAANSGSKVTVVPESFALGAGESQQLTVTADLTDVAIGDWYLQQLPLYSMSGVPNVHLPVAAKSAVSDFPNGITIQATAATDKVTVDHLIAKEITAGTTTVNGLAKATVHQGALISDPTRDDPYDGGFDPLKDGQQFFGIDIPEGTTRFVAEITQSASGDLDLYIGTGQTPTKATKVAEGATFGALEYVEILAPAAGQYWVLVDNWEAGHSQPQAYTVQTGVVGPDLGNMTITMPTSQPAGEPFSVDVNFQLPGSVAGDHYYGAFSLGTDAAHPDNLGTIIVDLIRQ